MRTSILRRSGLLLSSMRATVKRLTAWMHNRVHRPSRMVKTGDDLRRTVSHAEGAARANETSESYRVDDELEGEVEGCAEAAAATRCGWRTLSRSEGWTVDAVEVE